MVCVHLTANPLAGLPALLWPIDFFFSWFEGQNGSRPPHRWSFEIKFRHITLGRTPLDEWSASRRDLYLTTRNNHKRQTPPWRDSNPQSQQVSDLRLTSWTARHRYLQWTGLGVHFSWDIRRFLSLGRRRSRWE
jgi:hypothetical protein